MFKRVILIILDGVGIGALPDAAKYGDRDAATLQHVSHAVGGLSLPQLERLGLGNIASIEGVTVADPPLGCWGKMIEKSAGKDSITGHWELAGVPVPWDWTYFPDTKPAFPDALTQAALKAAGGAIYATDGLNYGQPVYA